MMFQSIIFLAGLALYASLGIKSACALVLLTTITFYAGKWIPQRRWVMPLSVTMIAALLLAVRVIPQAGVSRVMPLGFSFLSLQAVSYLVDVHRGRIEPENRFLRYGLYLTYFPHVFMGPIERYEVMAPALFENRCLNWDSFSEGAARTVWALFKKLVIASWAAIPIRVISENPEIYRGVFALAAMLLYSVQLYADFSGGMDIVLGISQMLGIRLSENFNVPFCSESVREFWQRWHITLGNWLRDYIYIPLGGSRKGSVRRVLNVLLTFLVSGLWHGPQYLVWGLLNGLFVSVGEKFRTKWKWVNRGITYLIISLLWAFFIWPDSKTAMEMIFSVFSGFTQMPFLHNIGTLGLTTGEMAVLACSVMLLFSADGYREKAKLAYRKASPAIRVAVVCGISFLVLVFGVYGIGFEAQAFIYSRF